MDKPATEAGLIGVGRMAALIGYSPSGLKKLERLGVVPPAARIEGSNLRVWPASEVEAIRARVEARRRAQKEEVPLPTAAA